MAVSAICGQLLSYSDACEALSVIEVTLGFLSTAGGNPNMPLSVYVQDMLRMGDRTALALKVGLGWALLRVSPRCPSHFLLGLAPFGGPQNALRH